VLTVIVCGWLLLMERGFAVNLYCSDVSGAFDRVERARLCDKLRTLGLHPDVLGFLESWLEDRESQVVLGGAASFAEALVNSVFQGTVLGPPLWNVFFADARRALLKHGFSETVFADDLNAWKRALLNVGDANPHDALLASLGAVQAELHQWGAANRVRFDPGKESFHVLHRRKPHGEDFKVLGYWIGCKLLMHAARYVATDAGWRLRALLRSRRFFTVPELMRSYKAQILSFVESSTPTLFHAAPSIKSHSIIGRYSRHH
jgi:hypothetical protein